MRKSIFNDDHLYTIYNVTLAFREKCFGGQPKSREILEKWIESKGEMPREPMAEKEQVLDLTEETEQVWCGFRANGKGIYLRDFQIEAMLKTSGTTLSIFVNKRGSKTIAQNGLHISPREIHFTGKKEPDGYDDIAGHVMTPQGKRSILKRCDYVQGAEITFQIKLLKFGTVGKEKDQPIPKKVTATQEAVKGIQNKLSEIDLLQMLHIGQDCGLGSCRSLGGGKFDVVAFGRA